MRPDGPTTSSRLLTLLSLLQTRRDWPGEVVAERLGVSTRTVRRDVDRLRELGYRIESTPGHYGGYRLDAGADLPPLLFDDDQAVALVVGLRLASVAGAGVEESALRALVTLRQVVPSRLRHRIDALDVVPLATAGRTEIDPTLLVEVGAAVRAHQSLRFTYDAGEVVRRVEPHHVVTAGRRWYLVAWDLDRDDWRTFRLDRMTLRVPHGPHFTPRELPGGDVRAFVSSRFKGADPGAGWPCSGEVVLRMPATDIRPFAGEALVEEIGPDRTRVVDGSWSWIALATRFLRFDADLEAVSPPELADAFRQLAARAAAASQP